MKVRYISVWVVSLLLWSLAGCGRISAPVTVVETVRPTAAPVEQIIVTEPCVPGRLLLIGDMRICGLRDLSLTDEADHFCCPEMNVFTAADMRLSDRSFHDMTLRELLAEREYSAVVVCLGLNESGYPMDSLIRGFQELAGLLVRTQPQSTIVFHAVITVGQQQARQVPYTAPENLERINTQIRKLALGYRVQYLEMDPWFTDDAGYLRSEASVDGCHLTPAGCRRWAKWLDEQIPRLEE